jgi:hypothetical protein
MARAHPGSRIMSNLVAPRGNRGESLLHVYGTWCISGKRLGSTTSPAALLTTPPNRSERNPCRDYTTFLGSQSPKVGGFTDFGRFFGGGSHV